MATMAESPYMRLLAREGVVAALLIYIVWWLLTSFATSMTVSASQHGQMLQVMQNICSNTAKTDNARDACFKLHKD